MLDEPCRMNPTTATATTVAIDVVICTYNRASNLDDVLAALSAQRVDRSERQVGWEGSLA